MSNYLFRGLRKEPEAACTFIQVTLITRGDTWIDHDFLVSKHVLIVRNFRLAPPCESPYGLTTATTTGCKTALAQWLITCFLLKRKLLDIVVALLAILRLLQFTSVYNSA